jgi:hypothetical protein
MEDGNAARGPTAGAPKCQPKGYQWVPGYRTVAFFAFVEPGKPG